MTWVYCDRVLARPGRLSAPTRNWMLVTAAEDGRADYLRALRALGAGEGADLDAAFAAAARAGELECLRLLWSWRAGDRPALDPAFVGAASHAQPEALEQLWDWGARDLATAARVIEFEMGLGARDDAELSDAAPSAAQFHRCLDRLRRWGRSIAKTF